MLKPPTTDPKAPPPPRRARLDGKRRRRPGGRHAGKPPRDKDDDREPPPLAVNQRLGYRIPEWAALVGCSLPSVYRAINARKLKIININGIKYVPRAYAIKVGLITRDDSI